MIGRRDALAFIGAAAYVGMSGCGGSARTQPPARTALPEVPLSLDPLVDLVPAAGLVWLIDMRPVDLLASPGVAKALDLAIPGDHFDAFARRHGGIDPRRATRLVVAGFADVTLALARVAVDPARIEKAFSDRAVAVEGRAVDRGITRLWGSVGEEREQIALFGDQAVGIERGHFGPLRVASYFAQGKLKRSPQALHADPLHAVSERLGDAPVRGFAPGPFVGPWADGLGGLLRAATAAGASLEPAPSAEGEEAAVKLTVVVLGAWGPDAASAAERLGAAFNVLAEDPLGRLAALNHPKSGPHVVGNATEVRLEVILDATALARGIRDATSAEVPDIVASPRRTP